ncbi:hypothetical protein GCM10009577_14680 [Streptomyces javensis]|uniref:aldose epimerase family protein n=1 Tax=Streptomyces javensis TaxID=114698 RepID=UPI0031D825E3
MASATSVRPVDGGAWTLENDAVGVVVNPARGTDILSLVWKATGEEILWRSPHWVDRVPAADTADASDVSFFDNYAGGIQELFPNAGPPTTVRGAPLPFHGEAARRSWAAEAVETAGGTALRCVTRLARYPFRMTKTFWLDGSVLRFRSEVENLSTRALPSNWGLHPAFNTATVARAATVYGPFEELTAHPEDFGARQWMTPGEKRRVPAVAPGVGALELAPGEGPTADLGYATVTGGWFGLRSPGCGLVATMSWQSELFPEIWVWQECHAPDDYPWWGAEHIVAVEPHTTSPFMPLAERLERPGVPVVAGGSTLSAEFTLGVHAIADDEVPVDVDERGVPVLITVPDEGEGVA